MRNGTTGIAMAILAAALAACEPPSARSADQEAPPAVGVIRPARDDMTRTIALPGDLVGFNQAALYAKVSGYLARIDVDKGDSVKKGQILATIEVPELEQKLKRARASRDVERVTYDRLREVWDSDRRLVAREDVDIARGKFAQAEADVEELEAIVGYTRIVAPFDGVVTARYVDPGALIEADGHAAGAPGAATAGGAGKSPVVSVADISVLRVYVYVPEQETSLIRTGTPAALTLREMPGRQFQGTVARFAHALDLSTRTMLAEVDIPNPRGELYPGMYADVTLELERHPNALVVPSTAVGSAGGRSFVFAVRNDQLRKVAVEPGLASAGHVEIRSGLAGDEELVRNVTPALGEGDKVRAVAAGDARSAT
ncbi:MAG TPA: efflux RND transporter periplasmic adaptor subunit [Candidatus Binatia bacterium]|nr:efflux RND transporter periplasmic adaptor subunit [Candidatus Binatia bacterium]